MATLRIIIDDGNAAFEDNPDEMRRILHELADLVHPDCHRTVYDVNGNPVGVMTYHDHHHQAESRQRRWDAEIADPHGAQDDDGFDNGSE